jgi:Chemotaxis phosphatase CheX
MTALRHARNPTLHLAALLAHSVEQAVEIMCFAEACLIPAPPTISAPLSAQVYFSGSRTGLLELSAEPGVAAALTAAMLGMDSAAKPDQELLLATLWELARVICGRFISSLDPERPFEMRSGAHATCVSNSESISQYWRLPTGALRVVLETHATA